MKIAVLTIFTPATEKYLKEYRENIIKLADIWSIESPVDRARSTFQGVSIHYLVQLLSAKDGNKDDISNFLVEVNIRYDNFEDNCHAYFKALNIEE